MALRHVLTTLNRTKRKHECVTTTIRVWGHWNSHLKRGLQKWNAPGSTKFCKADGSSTDDERCANDANDCGTRPKFTQVLKNAEPDEAKRSVRNIGKRLAGAIVAVVSAIRVHVSVRVKSSNLLVCARKNNIGGEAGRLQSAEGATDIISSSATAAKSTWVNSLLFVVCERRSLRSQMCFWHTCNSIQLGFK